MPLESCFEIVHPHTDKLCSRYPATVCPANLPAVERDCRRQQPQRATHAVLHGCHWVSRSLFCSLIETVYFFDANAPLVTLPRRSPTASSPRLCGRSGCCVSSRRLARTASMHRGQSILPGGRASWSSARLVARSTSSSHEEHPPLAVSSCQAGPFPVSLYPNTLRPFGYLFTLSHFTFASHHQHHPSCHIYIHRVSFPPLPLPSLPIPLCISIHPSDPHLICWTCSCPRGLIEQTTPNDHVPYPPVFGWE